MEEALIATLIAIGGLVLGAVFGYSWTASSIKTDCDTLHATRFNGEVYSCKKEPKT